MALDVTRKDAVSTFTSKKSLVVRSQYRPRPFPQARPGCRPRASLFVVPDLCQTPACPLPATGRTG
jgi:hypothetical protein